MEEDEWALLRDALNTGLRNGDEMGSREGFGIHVQFENARHHDHGLRPMPVFEHCELQGFSAVDKEAATKAVLILDDPTSVAVFANPEQRGFRTAR
jgi:hypothetical protein